MPCTAGILRRRCCRCCNVVSVTLQVDCARRMARLFKVCLLWWQPNVYHLFYHSLLCPRFSIANKCQRNLKGLLSQPGAESCLSFHGFVADCWCCLSDAPLTHCLRYVVGITQWGVLRGERPGFRCPALRGETCDPDALEADCRSATQVDIISPTKTNTSLMNIDCGTDWMDRNSD